MEGKRINLRLLLWSVMGWLGCYGAGFADGNREVIEAQVIAREKPANLMELLTKRVGLGDAGGALSLRGVPKVVLYVDGFPRDGAVIELNKVKPQDVARIEILRGAASARYGADALGGALVITTKQGKKHWSLDLIQGYDSLNSRYSRAITSGAVGASEMRATFEDSITNKFINRRSDGPIASLVQTQDAYFAKRGGDFKLGYKNDWLTGGAELNYLEQTRNFGRPNSYNDYTTIRPKLMLEARFDELKLNGNLMYEDTRLDVHRDGGGLDAEGLALFLTGPEITRTLNLEIQAGYRNTNIGIVYGLIEDKKEQWRANGGQLSFALKDTVERVGVFGSHGFNFWQDWRLDLSGRYDVYDYYDVSVANAEQVSWEPATSKQAFNPKLSLSWQSLPWLGVRASAATGFLPPSPSTLYYRQERPNYLIVPTPGLQPEQSLTLDFGMEAKWGETQAGLTLFYTRWTDKIERLTTAGTPAVQTSVNLGESESKGVEFNLNAPLFDSLDLAFNYTLTFTEIVKSVDPAIMGNELPYQPRHRLNAVLTYQGIPDLTTRLNLHYESAQFMDIRNLRHDDQGYSWVNGDYVSADFLLTRKFGWKSAGIDLTLAINNLFDNRYARSFFDSDPGRIIRGEIGLRF
jgi:outer membrane receptor protein involved in Fe transport